MAKERRRITIECREGDYLDNELWEALQKYSNPASIIKDMLKGLVSLPVLKKNKDGE